MNHIFVINGPNLGRLQWRDSSHYGELNLEEIEELVRSRAGKLGLGVTWFQSDSEGSVVEAIHEAIDSGAGIVINPGALTHYSYAVADALEMSEMPVVEVHLSNVHAREEWRRDSVVAPVVTGSIEGLGPFGYVLAIEALFERVGPGGIDGEGSVDPDSAR